MMALMTRKGPEKKKKATTERYCGLILTAGAH